MSTEKNKREMKIMATMNTQASVLIHFARWADFVRFCKRAAMVVYKLKVATGVFRVCAVKDNVLAYEESLPLPQKTRLMKGKEGWEAEIPPTTDLERPEWLSKFAIISRQVIRKTFQCGVPYSILPKLVSEKGRWAVEFEYQLNPKEVSNLLSKTLEIPEKYVIQGDILKLFP